MPVQYSLLHKLLICLLLMFTGNTAIAQSKPGEHLGITRPFTYKNGVLFVVNHFVKEDKKDNSLLTGEKRPRGVYGVYVSGKRTAICFMPYPPGMKDTIWFGKEREESRGIYLNPADLLVRISRNGKLEQDWKPVGHTTASTDTFIGYYPKKRAFEVFGFSDDTLQVDDVVVIDGKLRTDTSILFTYHIRRIAKSIMPRMFSYSHQWDGTESRISPDIIHRTMLKKDSLLKSWDAYYGDWLEGTSFHNTRIAAASRFTFYFTKSDSSFADSTMEYRFLGGKFKDTSWVKTGHVIFADGLTGNNHYSLEVRYIRYPGNTALYTFYTEPYWYQTNWFKGVIGTVSCLLVLLFAFLLYRHRLKKEKQKKVALSARLKGMQAQLNPHFIFNALGSIQALMNKQESDKAHQYLSTFGNLLRNILTNSNHDNTTLDQEIKSLDAYLQLEQLRFGFQYKIVVSDQLQTTVISMPVMLMQPLVENAVRHGVESMEEQGRIHLIFTPENSSLLVTIEDNGKGFDTTAPTQGYGLKLVQEKIQLLNALQEQQAIEISFRSTDAGTTVFLMFKNWLA